MAVPASRYLIGPVPWYSALIVCGAALAVWLSAREEKRPGLPKDTVIAIRNGISALSLFQRDKALENRARYEALLRRWLILD